MHFTAACLTSGLNGTQIAASFKAHCKAGKDEMTGKVTNCIPDEVRPTRLACSPRQHASELRTLPAIQGACCGTQN